MEDVKIKKVEEVDVKEDEVKELQPDEDAKELQQPQSDNDDEVDQAKNTDQGNDAVEAGIGNGWELFRRRHRFYHFALSAPT